MWLLHVLLGFTDIVVYKQSITCNGGPVILPFDLLFLSRWFVYYRGCTVRARCVYICTVNTTNPLILYYYLYHNYIKIFFIFQFVKIYIEFVWFIPFSVKVLEELSSTIVMKHDVRSKASLFKSLYPQAFIVFTTLDLTIFLECTLKIYLFMKMFLPNLALCSWLINFI